MKKIIAIFFGLIASLHATTYFVTQSGAGSANGSTLGNAWSAANFNNSSNWSATPATAGKISPGDTVSLNGTITSALTAQGGGTAGNIITILFASGAKMSGSPFTGNFITITSHDYITIDGGTNGLLESLNNGTGLGSQVNNVGVKLNGSNHITVQNLTISPLYIRTAGAETNDYGVGIECGAGGGGNCNDLTVTGCTMANMVQGVGYTYHSGASNITVYNNNISYINWGVFVGDNGTSGDTMSGIRIYGNIISQWANWEQTGNFFHHNGVFIFCNNTGGGASDMQIYNNTFGPGFGAQNTSAIYINGTINSATYCYNNLFIPAADEGPANGMITLRAMNVNNTNYVFNNVFVQPGAGPASCGLWMQIDVSGVAMTVIAKNNIYTGNWYYNVIYLPGSGTIPYTGTHNIYYNSPHFGDAGGQETLAVWKALGAGFDNDAVTTDPKLDGTYHLQVGSSAISAGENQTALGITALNSDKAGSARPIGSTAWDDGVYNYTSSSGSGGSSLSGSITLKGSVILH